MRERKNEAWSWSWPDARELHARVRDSHSAKLLPLPVQLSRCVQLWLYLPYLTWAHALALCFSLPAACPSRRPSSLPRPLTSQLANSRVPTVPLLLRRASSLFLSSSTRLHFLHPQKTLFVDHRFLAPIPPHPPRSARFIPSNLSLVPQLCTIRTSPSSSPSVKSCKRAYYVAGSLQALNSAKLVWTVPIDAASLRHSLLNSLLRSAQQGHAAQTCPYQLFSRVYRCRK